MYSNSISLKQMLLVCLLTASLSCINSADSTEEDQGYLRPVCSHELRWVPLRIRQAYTTLLNSAYCPSWTTRHIITKRPQNTYLRLPKGIPLAFLCGLCHHPSSVLESNITVTQHVGYSEDQKEVAQVPVRRSPDSLEFHQRGMECVVQYTLTGPMTESGGKLTCDALYGRLMFQEQVTYNVYDVPIDTKEETIDVPGNTAILTCPGHPDAETASNPLVHVWYYPLATSPRIAAPTTNPTVTFRLSATVPLVVSCATYHILSVTRVVVTTFTVRRSESHQLQGEAIIGSSNAGDRGASVWDTEQSYGAYGGAHEDQPVQSESNTAGFNLPTVMVAVLSAAAAIVAVIALFGIARCIKRKRRQ